MVVLRNEDIEENRSNGQKLEKNDFPYFDVLRHQKHPYVSRIQKKSLQGSIHIQFYITITGPFGRSLLQPCTVSVKRRKNKFPTPRRCSILVKASPDRCIQKRTRMHSNQCLRHGHLYLTSVNVTTHWRVHQTRHSRACCDQQTFWQACANGHRCPQERNVKRCSI